jgi:signal transduction histidine kinase
MKQFIFTILLLSIFLNGYAFAKKKDSNLESTEGFTSEERNWIKDHPNIRLSPDPDFLPIEFIDQSGKYVGIAADYVRLLEKKLDINFEILKFKTWDEVIDKAKKRETDMWGAATPTPQRLGYMLFTEPYIELPAVIIVRNNTQASLSLKELKGLKVAVISGYGIHDYLSLNNAEIKLDVVSDISTGLKKVSFGMVDAMIANIALATHYIEKDGISNLRVAGESGYIYKWGLANRNDWPQLNTILQKGINLINENEKKEIYRKWVGLKTNSSVTFKDIAVPVLSFLGIFAVIAIIISNRVLKKQVLKRTEDLQKELFERKEIDQKLETANQSLELSNKELKSFASITSHDLKTPIRKIANFCSFIEAEEQNLSNEGKKNLIKIGVAAKHAADLIDGILRYSQLGEDKTLYKKINLNEIALKVLEYLEVEIKETNGKVEYSNLPSIYGNELQIEQLFENLISNSLKYRRDEIAPIIEIGHSRKNGKDLQLFLKDNGIGFNNVYAEKIFDPFQRLDGDISRLGSGLGLSICKKIMLRHEGDIVAEGEVGQGAKFTLTFKRGIENE